ncbi:MAG TPA: hypothetical protein VF941_09915 [Clostridia bacterium]
MYLIEPRTIDIVIKQFLYKLKTNLSVFYGIAAIELFAVFAASGGVSSSGTSSTNLSVKVNLYSADIVIVFAIIWIFIASLRFSINQEEMDFSLVSNRFCSNVSSMCFLAVASIVSGITASLYTVILRIAIYYGAGSGNIVSDNFFISPQYLVIGIASSILYIILFCSAGYLYGVLIRLSKLFVLFVPACLIGELITLRIFNPSGHEFYISKITNFYFSESSLLLFFVKAIVTSIVLFTSALLISDRLEVRR